MVTPLDNPAVRGYYAYITVGEMDEVKIPAPGLTFAYPVPATTNVSVRISAYDILGEGGKSGAAQTTTQELPVEALPPIPREGLADDLLLELDALEDEVGSHAQAIELISRAINVNCLMPHIFGTVQG